MAGLVGKTSRRTTGSGVSMAAQSERRNMHSSLPGQIVSFDPATQTATVKIMFKPTVNGEAVDPPVLQEVPVVQPRGGGFAVTAPLGAGDWVNLSFDGADTSAFRDSGEASQAASDRMNSLSDAVATPGRGPDINAMSAYDPDNMFIGSDDGKNGIRVSPDGKVAFEGNGQDLVTILHELLGLLEAELTTPTGLPFSKSGDYAALKSRLGSMKLR